MVSVKKLQPIYSKDYYRMEKLVLSKRFQKSVRWVRDEYRKLGHPIPKKGFKSNKEYISWFKSFAPFYHDLNKKEADRAIMPIKNNKTLSGFDKAVQITKTERRLLALLPNTFVESLMEEYGLDTNNDKYFEFIRAYIFRGQKHLLENPVTATLKRNAGSIWELSISVSPYTTLYHIQDSWKEIKKLQKFLPEYLGKNKERKKFERDLHIYDIHQKAKYELGRKRATFFEDAIDVEAQRRLHDEGKKGFKRLTLSQIRQAVARIQELDITNIV
jgi:hypothetical protein